MSGVTKTASIVIISTLVIAGFGMGNPFASHRSNFTKVATNNTPQVATPRITTKTKTAPDLTTLAEQALKKGNLDLAEQYAVQFARLNPDQPVAFINLMRAICHQRNTNALNRVDRSNGKSIRNEFNNRLNAINKITVQIDLFLNARLDVKQINALIALKTEMNHEKLKLQNEQHAAFESFAQNQYSKARNLFHEGKGKPWYCIINTNDNETKFEDALVELLGAFKVIDQLDIQTRNKIIRFETTLKSELNQSEFDAAKQRASMLNR